MYRVTVNSEIFAGILISRKALKEIFHDYDMIYLQSDFSISRGFYFHETSQMRSFAKKIPRENFGIYSNQCAATSEFSFCTPSPL